MTAPLHRRRRLDLRSILPLAACLAGISAPVRAAQPGMGPAGPGAGPPAQRKDKKDGPAEEAPKDKEALQPIVPVPAQPERQRRIQLFELHGYFRTRADYFHRLDMELGSSSPLQNPETNNKFFRPPAQTPEQPKNSNDPTRLNDANCFARLDAQGVAADKASRRCDRRKGFGSANLRLRLEPTLHVTDTIRVHAQIDALDNIVLGSTPDSYAWDNPFAPIDFYTRTQTPPTSGINSFTDSILVKRAWGHIKFGFGLDLQFGRMPWQWGMGVVANNGNGYYRGDRDDIIWMLDADYGDSVDSIRLAFDFGKDRRRAHTVGLSWDWAASGPTTSQLLGPQWASGGKIGQDFAAEKFHNVYQWSLFLERRDQPEMLRRKLSLGTPVLNYGLMNWLRYQDVDRAIGAPGLGDGLGTNGSYAEEANIPDDPDGDTSRPGDPLGNGDTDQSGRTGLERYANVLVHRRAILYTPDIWVRVNWRTLRIELEAAANIGRFYHRDLSQDVYGTGDAIDELEQVLADQKSLIQSMGYALEFKYGFFQDRFHIGLDHGFAMGDETPSQNQNPQDPLLNSDNDGNVRNFRFNPSYQRDLLLFREMLGTVSNAGYFKPWAAFYFLDHNFSARLDIGYALAHKKSSTYGNKRSWGIELDGAVRYHDRNDPIFVQIQYGVLFPLGGFDRPRGLYGGNVPNGGDAKAVQTVQGQIGIKF